MAQRIRALQPPSNQPPQDLSQASLSELIAGAHQYAAAKKPAPDRNSNYGGDLATSVGTGLLQLPGIATGLGDIVTAPLPGNRLVSRAADALGEFTGFQPGKWAADRTKYLTPETQAAKANVDQAFQQNGIMAGLGAYLKNPRALGTMAVESLPATLAGGLGGLGLKSAAGATTLLPRLLTNPVVAGAAGEGLITAGSQMGQIDPKVNEFKAAGASLLAGAGTSLLAGVGGQLAKKLGIGDPETILSGGGRRTLAEGEKPRSLLTRVIGGGISEGVLQELPQGAQEQMLQNWANGDEIFKDVGRSAVESMLAGTAMGGVAGPFGTNTPAPTTVDATDPESTTGKGITDTTPEKLIAAYGTFARIASGATQYPDLSGKALQQMTKIRAELVRRGLPPEVADEQLSQTKYAMLHGDLRKVSDEYEASIKTNPSKAALLLKKHGKIEATMKTLEAQYPNLPKFAGQGDYNRLVDEGRDLAAKLSKTKDPKQQIVLRAQMQKNLMERHSIRGKHGVTYTGLDTEPRAKAAQKAGKAVKTGRAAGTVNATTAAATTGAPARQIAPSIEARRTQWAEGNYPAGDQIFSAKTGGLRGGTDPNQPNGYHDRVMAMTPTQLLKEQARLQGEWGDKKYSQSASAGWKANMLDDMMQGEHAEAMGQHMEQKAALIASPVTGQEIGGYLKELQDAGELTETQSRRLNDFLSADSLTGQGITDMAAAEGKDRKSVDETFDQVRSKIAKEMAFARDMTHEEADAAMSSVIGLSSKERVKQERADQAAARAVAKANAEAQAEDEAAAAAAAAQETYANPEYVDGVLVQKAAPGPGPDMPKRKKLSLKPKAQPKLVQGDVYEGDAASEVDEIDAAIDGAVERGASEDEIAVLKDQLQEAREREYAQTISDSGDAEYNQMRSANEMIGGTESESSAGHTGTAGVVQSVGSSQDTNTREGAFSMTGFLKHIPIDAERVQLEQELEEAKAKPGYNKATLTELRGKLAKAKKREKAAINKISDQADVLQALKNTQSELRSQTSRLRAMQDILPRVLERPENTAVAEGMWRTAHSVANPEKKGRKLDVPELTWGMVLQDGYLLNQWIGELGTMFTAWGINADGFKQMVANSTPEDRGRITRRLIDGVNFVGNKGLYDGKLKLTPEVIEGNEAAIEAGRVGIAEAAEELARVRRPISDALDRVTQAVSSAREEVESLRASPATTKPQKAAKKTAVAKAESVLEKKLEVMQKAFNMSTKLAQQKGKRHGKRRGYDMADDAEPATLEALDLDTTGEADRSAMAPATNEEQAALNEMIAEEGGEMADASTFGTELQSIGTYYADADESADATGEVYSRTDYMRDMATRNKATVQSALGKAKPQSAAVWDSNVTPDVEQILRSDPASGAGTLQRALQAIAKTGPKEVQALARTLSRLMPDNAAVRVDDVSNVNCHGSMSWALGIPTLNLFTAEYEPGVPREGMTYSTILHEALHMAVFGRYHLLRTGAYAENYDTLKLSRPKAEKQLHQMLMLWQEFEKTVDQSDLTLDTSITEAARDPDEFFVRALTDPVLQDYLSKQLYKGQTMWTRFKDWVKKTLFGYSGTAPSWLDAALLASHELLDAMGQDAADLSYHKALVAHNKYRNSRNTANKRIFHTDDAQVDQAYGGILDKTGSAGKRAWNTLGKYTRRYTQQMMFTQDLADMNEQILPGISLWNRTVSAFRSARNDLDVKTQQIVDPIARLSKQQRKDLYTFLADATRAEVWAFDAHAAGITGEDVTIDPKMAARFNKMPKVMQDITVNMVRHTKYLQATLNASVAANMQDTYDSYIERLADPEKIAKVEAERDEKIAEVMGRTDEGKPMYLPFRRFGDFAVVHKSETLRAAQAAQEEDLVAELKADPAHYYVRFFDSHFMAQGDEARLRKKHGDTVEMFERAQMERNSDFLPTSLMESIRSKLEADEFVTDEFGGESRKASIAGMVSALNKVYIASLNEESARKSELTRENVAGFEEDMVRSFVSYATSMSASIAGLDTHRATTENLQSMKNTAREPGDRDRKNAVLNEVLERHRIMMDPNPSPFVDKIMGATSLWMLVTSPAYFIQNLTQPFMVTWPILGGEFGMVKSWYQLTKSYKTVGKAWVPGIDGQLAEINPKTVPNKNHRKVLEALQKRGLLDVGLAADLGSLKNPSGVFGMKQLNDVHQVMIHGIRTVELFNRGISAIAAFDMHHAKHGDIDAATDFAISTVANTQFNYGKENEPSIFGRLGGVGRVALQFRKFQIGQLSLIARTLHGMFKGATPQAKWMAAKQFAYMMSTHGAVAGLMGLPAVNIAGFLIAHMFGDDDEPKDFELMVRRGMKDKNAADLLLHGLPTMAGIDVGSRLGMGQATSVLPFTDISFTRDGAATAAAALLGPSVAQAGAIVDGMGMVGQGNTLLGIAQMMPRGIRDVMRAAAYANEGVTMRNATRDVVLDKDDLSWADIGLQGLGWPTQKLSDRYAVGKWLKMSEDTFTERSSELQGEWVRKPAERGRIRREWMELQKVRRQYGFKPNQLSTLTNASRNKLKRERSVISGVEVTPSNQRFARQMTQ